MRAILLSGGLALILSLVGTRYAIKLLTAKGYGQEIREDGPTSHHTKRGTPTMGGIVVILSSVAGYFFAKIVTQDLPSASAMLLIFLFSGIGNASTFKQMPMIFERRQAGGVIGWTAAIAAFGPFLFGVGLTLMSPALFYLIGIAWAVMCVAITWWRYARPGAPKPS